MIEVKKHLEYDKNCIKEVYCDGGLISRNPSHIGGSWAFVAVDENRHFLYSCADVIVFNKEQRQKGIFITNNTTETIAICKALEYLPYGWEGTIVSDSECALTRLVGNPKFQGCPGNVINRFKQARERLGRLSIIQVSGHPDDKDLQGVNGYCHKTGLPLGRKIDKNGNPFPVSMWNEYCDILCGEVMEPYKIKKGVKSECNSDESEIEGVETVT